MNNSLWLFDIDGTLVDTGGAGLRALEDTTREIFGSDGPKLELAGATDGGILKLLYANFEREEDEETTARFFEYYLAHLEHNLADPCFGGMALPGTLDLLDELRQAGIAKGLLTGNIAAGAEMKMSYYGMDHYFPFGAYGDDHFDRNLLGPIALLRAKEALRREFRGQNVVVIGDTPKDISCAKAIGARSLAVATGRFSADELERAGAHFVFETLEDHDEIFRHLFP